jgi:hypothetical protein
VQPLFVSLQPLLRVTTITQHCLPT